MSAKWLLLTILAVLAMVTTVRAERRDWVGTARCGSCHPQQLAAWQTTRHALTRDRFAGTRPEARCLACHGTGEAPAGPTVAVEVGCEACHGAGAAYATDDLMRNRVASQLLGLVSDRTVCASCHARPTSRRPFDARAPVHAAKAP